MFDQPIRICALILCVLAIAVSSTPDIIDDLKNTLTGKSSSGGSGVNFNLDGSGASIGVRKDENMFYYMECSAGVSTGGLNAGCQRVWKALFYVCVVGGGLLAVLLLSCCFCCCCAPCRKKRIVTYQPVSHLGQISSVVVHPQTNPNPPPPSYGDVPMLRP